MAETDSSMPGVQMILFLLLGLFSILSQSSF